MDQIGDINQLTLAVLISYQDNQREVSCALYDQDKRMIQVSEFQDNEHFSTFESLILQANPCIQLNDIIFLIESSDTKFTVLIQLPEMTPDAAKIKDIFAQCEFDVLEKSKKEFVCNQGFEEELSKILQRPMKQYVIESNMQKALNCVSCITDHYKLHRDASNFGKFQLAVLNITKFMKLDLAAINALQIFPKPGQDKQNNDGSNQNITLVDYLDKCRTAMGKRCLRRWIKMPLQSTEEINKRLNIVEFLFNNSKFRSYLQDEFLKKIPDLDKLYAKFFKVSSQKKHSAGLSDCLKVYQLLHNMRELVRQTQEEMKTKQSQILNDIFLNPFVGLLEDFSKLEDMIEKSIDLTKAYQNEYIVNPKFSEKLMVLSKKIAQTLKEIEDIRNQTQQDLDIQVTMSDSGTYTYVFEANKKLADEAFRRKGGKKYKTLTVKNRQLTFTVEELQAAVAEYNLLKEEYATEQATVVEKILNIVATYYPAMEESSLLISQLDVYCSFALVAYSAPRDYVRPILCEGEIVLKDSRHPLLESIDASCIMNDLQMNRENSRLHVITGPNMGGKSTYIRQIAICILMSHIGCFIPCSYAKLPIIDAIITRVGASDMQMRGISTFMSEMLEASCMLKTAKQNSLVIIDELGRGTSTSEGFGIAWAIAEHIAEELRSFCLFATHFHEMTLMEKEVEGVKNYYVSCLTIDDRITMQYKVREGAVDRSYGLMVAEMLKFPAEVLRDAKLKAEELESFENNVITNNMIEEEAPQHFESISEEIQYYARSSSLQQKEQVILEYQRYKVLIDDEVNSAKKDELQIKMKRDILQLLKQH